MIDLKAFRQNPDLYIKAAQDKQFEIDFPTFQKLDQEIVLMKQKIEEIQARRNTASKEIEQIKRSGWNADALMESVKNDKAELERLDKEYAPLSEKFEQILMRIPNIVLDGVPFGESDEKNVEEAQIGEKRVFDFQPLPHWELLEKKNLLDAQRAAKISGSRFLFLRGDLVMLEFALIQWALKKLQKKGFQPTIVPNIVRKDAMMSTGYLPYGEESIYKIMDEEGQQQYLIGTSEVTLVAQHSDEMIDENQLPLRYGGFSPCYRGEAGTYGKDTKGMIRVHQFEKVEMVSFVKPEDSEKEHQLILAIEEEIFQELKIPYRRLLICTGDLGVPAAKKYDLEAWFPGLGTYKEVTSCSNCTDFQARRAQIKYKTTEKKEFLHTLNGTAVAVSRTLAAIVENYQQADGSIMIPEVLQPYFEGKQTM
mgnify:CR=1 FL=1